MQGLAEADVGLFVVDARSGLTTADQEIAEELRRQNKPDPAAGQQVRGAARRRSQAAEGWALGLGEPMPVSGGAWRRRSPICWRHWSPISGPPRPAERAIEAEARPLRLAVIGRPNAGKSSLVNRLIDEERMLTGPEPGLTRDSVSIRLTWQGRTIELVDTAGLRRKARVDAKLEKLSTSATLRSLKFADVVALMIDATMPLERQDLTIARLVAQEGRALVVVLNKWDLIEDPNAAMAEIRHTLTSQLADVRGVPCVPLSALTGRNVEKLLPAVVARLQPLGQPCLDRRAQSLAGRGAGAASPAAGPGAPGQDPLRHPVDGPPADLHPVRQQAGRRAAGQLPALSGGGPARHLRPGWGADPLPRPARREPLRQGLTEPDELALTRAAGQQQLDHRRGARHPAAAPCRAARRDSRPCAAASPSARDRAG